MEGMMPERRQLVEKLFHEAADLTDGERQTYLTAACAGDLSLRAEVERLIASHKEAGSFMGAPAINIAAGPQAAAGEGQFLNQYKILGLLGRGGMGEVYRARDSRLGRDVAIKVLPSSFAQDEGLLRRFQQEARAASALNHQNILIIHDFGEANSTPFIAAELIHGRTLRERLDQGPLPIDEALRIAIQVADALAAAHDAKIIHRDIKPANIMLRDDGTAKILDFGLAKFMERLIKQEISTTAAPSSNLSLVHTARGTFVGTYKYASPEQLQAQDTDGRADVWSLGVVLYEMIAGEAPFTGSTLEEITEAVLKQEPLPLDGFSLDVSDELQRIISKTLSKDRGQRYQTIRDLLLDLKTLREKVEFENRTGLAKGEQGLFIGEKYVKYMVRWRTSERAGFPVFNWPACLLPIPWLAYRKMYLCLSLLLLGALAGGLLLAKAGMYVPHVTLTLGLGSALGLGVFGNTLYRWHVARTLRSIKRRNFERPQERALIVRAGGTSWLAGAAGLALTLAVVLLLPEGLLYVRKGDDAEEQERRATAVADEARLSYSRAAGIYLQVEDLQIKLSAVEDLESGAELIKGNAREQIGLLTQVTLLMRESSDKFGQADALLEGGRLKMHFGLMRQTTLKFAEMSELRRQQADALLKIGVHPLDDTLGQYRQIGLRAEQAGQEVMRLLLEARKLLQESTADAR